jgi:hypothetical protein
MITTIPHLTAIIAISIIHKEQEFLLVSIESLYFHLPNTIEVYYIYKDTITFKVKCYYYQHTFQNNKYFYEYGAYNEEIFQNYMKEQEKGFFDHTYDFLYVDPYTHEISPLSFTSDNKKLCSLDNILSVKETYISPNYNIITTVNYPLQHHKDLVKIPIQEEFSEYMDIIAQQEDYNIIENDGSYEVILPLEYKSAEIIKVKYIPYKNTPTKNIDIYLPDNKYKLEEILVPIRKITTYAFIYHNRAKILTLHLKQVPENLSMENYILYNNLFYKIIEFSIASNERCQITAAHSEFHMKDPEGIYINTPISISSLFSLVDNQLFIKNKCTLKSIREYIYNN